MRDVKLDILPQDFPDAPPWRMNAIAPFLRAKKWSCPSHPHLEGVILFVRAARYRRHGVAHFRRILDGQVSKSTNSNYLRSIGVFGSDLSEGSSRK